MEIAAGSLDRSFPAARDIARPLETAAMENRESDYDGLIRPMESRMMRSIWRIVRQKEAAEDALQEALALVWKKRDTVARHPNPQALILKISVDAAYDAVRKSRRRLRHEIQVARGEYADVSAAPPAREAEDKSLRAEVLEAIGRLPKRQASAVLLRVVEEQSYEEIAKAMGCSEATARIHVMRGRAVLARRLARYRPHSAGGAGEPGREAAS